MYNVANIPKYCPRWQSIVMLLGVLSQTRRNLARQEANYQIRNNLWFDIQREDCVPYRSQMFTSREPRWETGIAWARKDCVERGLMSKDGHDEWEATGEGYDAFASFLNASRIHVLDVRRCYLWSRHFKHYMDSTYKPSEADADRPLNLYEDWLPRGVEAALQALRARAEQTPRRE